MIIYPTLSRPISTKTLSSINVHIFKSTILYYAIYWVSNKHISCNKSKFGVDKQRDDISSVRLCKVYIVYNTWDTYSIYFTPLNNGYSMKTLSFSTKPENYTIIDKLQNITKVYYINVGLIVLHFCWLKNQRKSIELLKFEFTTRWATFFKKNSCQLSLYNILNNRCTTKYSI